MSQLLHSHSLREKKKKKKIRISEFLAEQKTGMNMFFFLKEC